MGSYNYYVELNNVQLQTLRKLNFKDNKVIIIKTKVDISETIELFLVNNYFYGFGNDFSILIVNSDFDNTLVEQLVELVETTHLTKVDFFIVGSVDNELINKKVKEYLVDYELINSYQKYDFKELYLLKTIEYLNEDKRDLIISELINKYPKLLSLRENFKTYESFIDNNLSIAVTSRNLYMHRNTLIYKLDKLEGETGLDIRDFNDALTMKIFLNLIKK